MGRNDNLFSVPSAIIGGGFIVGFISGILNGISALSGKPKAQSLNQKAGVGLCVTLFAIIDYQLGV